jgi:transcriptional regulator with XRE-family HTH domain
MSRQQKNKVFFDKVCDRIRLLTIERNLANYELANRAGISGKTVYSIINKKVEPSNKVISAVAGALGVSVDYLMTGEGEKRAAPMMVRESGPVYGEAEQVPDKLHVAVAVIAEQLNLPRGEILDAVCDLAKKKLASEAKGA